MNSHARLLPATGFATTDWRLPSSRGRRAAFVLQVLAAVAIVQPSGAVAQRAAGTSAAKPPTIAERTNGLEHRAGLFTLHYEAETGRLFMELPPSPSAFLYFPSLTSGITWPMERGIMSSATLAHFERAGSRVLLLGDNPRLQATGPDSARLAPVIAEVFSRSVLASFDVVAEDESGASLIDITDRSLRDAFDIVAVMRRTEGGTLAAAAGMSRVVFSESWATPRETAVATELTFSIEDAAGNLRRQVRAGGTVSVGQLHHFVALPTGYRPRALDARMGLDYLLVHDFGGAFDTGKQRRFISRWRLEKKQPTAELSEPVRPVTIYLDAGIPAAYRQTLRDGLLYWNRVFEAAGFRNAIRVEDLPAGAEPSDTRYEITVLWTPSIVGVSSRVNWIVDPRTGELLKAVILFNPHLLRSDYNTWMAMRPALAPGQPDATAVVMARARWLIGNEAGHVLAGLYHEAINPSQTGVLSPDVRAHGDRVTLDLSTACFEQPTPYDEWVIRYAYTPFASPEDEREGLARIVSEGTERGLQYVDDYGTGSFPRATQLVRADDPLGALEVALDARRVMLARFSEAALEPGEDRIVLADRLVPLYFHHRYALWALAKAVGGVEYAYGRKGDSLPSTRPIDPRVQRRALDALVAALAPPVLDIPPHVTGLIPPQAWAQFPSEFADGSDDPSTYSFITSNSPPIRVVTEAGGIFEPTAWARALCEIELDRLLDRQRLARLASLNANDSLSPSPVEVLHTLVEGTWGAPVDADSRLAALRRVAQRSVLDHLLALLGDGNAGFEVHAAVFQALARLAAQLHEDEGGDAVRRAHVALALRDVERALWGASDPPAGQVQRRSMRAIVKGGLRRS